MTRHLQARGVLVAVVLNVCGVAPAFAQTDWFNSFRTFSVYVENDALASWKPADERTDERYTQGLRLTWDFAVWPDWASSIQRKLSPLRPNQNACEPAITRASDGCGTVSFGLGQTIYSPTDIITPRLQPRDQPFAGWLFATMGLNARENRWQSTTELVVGVMGPPSIARNTQSLAHWTWAQGAPKPGGWDNQLKGSLHVGGMQTYSVHALEKCWKALHGCSGGFNERRVFDLSPRTEAVLTSTMVRLSGGAVVRVGYRFPDAIGLRIPATASPPPADGSGLSTEAKKGWVAVFATADARLVGYNAFISGSYADRGPGEWKRVSQIEPRRSVNEMSVGAAGGIGVFALSFDAVSRSQEWDPILPSRTGRPGRHNYLSLNVSLSTGQ